MLVTLTSEETDLNKAIIPVVEAIFSLTHESSLQEIHHIRSEIMPMVANQYQALSSELRNLSR